MGEVTPQVVSGVTELELARDIDFAMRSKGSLAPSFDTGVWGMGPASERDATVRISGGAVEPRARHFLRFRLGRRRLLLRLRPDGAGRRAPRDFSRVYDVVMEAQAAGIRAVRPGVPASSVHAATRASDSRGRPG